jgi:Fatty acid desaturase
MPLPSCCRRRTPRPDLAGISFCVVVLASLAGCCDAFSSQSLWIRNDNRRSIPRPQSLSDTTDTTSPSTTSISASTISPAAQWHRDRRQQMLVHYGDSIRSLERTANSQILGGILLITGNLSLTILAILCGRLATWKWTCALAVFPGSVLSLWQLQILHDNLHGCFLDKTKTHFDFDTLLLSKQRRRLPKKTLQQWILFWGSMPSIFGYYLYLQYGHLTHHQAVGNPQTSHLKQIFESSAASFEDGDVLFVAHRMKLHGDGGPRFMIGNKELVLSISNFGFRQWKTTTGRLAAFNNMMVFAMSFLLERIMLSMNDVIVALTGTNYFFLKKPLQFHRESASYCRSAVIVRALLWWLGNCSWHSLLFLFLSETLWSIPPHPATAMFVTNHGSTTNHGNLAKSPVNACIPSSSTYAGKWYSALTLGTNYHCEHHDFPTIPFHKLGTLRKIAPEFYRHGSKDKLWPIMMQAFGQPDYYACMNDIQSIR